VLRRDRPCEGIGDGQNLSCKPAPSFHAPKNSVGVEVDRTPPVGLHDANLRCKDRSTVISRYPFFSAGFATVLPGNAYVNGRPTSAETLSTVVGILVVAAILLISDDTAVTEADLAKYSPWFCSAINPASTVIAKWNGNSAEVAKDTVDGVR